MGKLLNGIYPALLTPFDKSGKLNKNALRQLVEMNIKKGVSGFYVCGSTAEAFFLSADERKEILETVAEQNNGRVQLLAHIGHIDTQTAIDLAKHASTMGVTAISSVSPFYYNFSFDEIRGYYFDIVDACDKPMIVYNFPAFAKVNLTEENIACFFDDPRFVALKHTSSDFFLLERLAKRYPDRSFMNGYDEMFLCGLASGADGAIGSTFNVMAEKFIAIQKAYRAGNFAEAQREQQKANNIIAAMVKVGVMSAEKALLNTLGLDFGIARKPFKALTSEQISMLESVYKENI